MIVNSAQADLDQKFSKILNREVTLRATMHSQEEVVESAAPDVQTATAEEYWPDMEGLDYRGLFSDFRSA